LKRSPDGKLDAALVGTGWRETNRRGASRADTADKTVRTVRSVRTFAEAAADLPEPYVPHPDDYRPANYPEGMAAIASCAAYSVAEALDGHLSLSIIEGIVDQVGKAVQREGAMMLDEEGVSLEPQYLSWLQHPLFTAPALPPLQWPNLPDRDGALTGATAPDA